MQRKTIPGHFTRVKDGQQIGIGEEEARRLLTGHCPDVDSKILEMKASPSLEVAAEGGSLVYHVHRAPPLAVGQGGPVLRGTHLFTAAEQVAFLLDLVADHDPLSYDHYYQRYQELDPPGLDRFAADLMEVLDNVAGPDITFTARPTGEDAFMTLGFWPTTEEETDEPS